MKADTIYYMTHETVKGVDFEKKKRKHTWDVEYYKLCSVRNGKFRIEVTVCCVAYYSRFIV